MTRREFTQKYPDWEWLESRSGCTRLSNGEGEGSENESLWFCDECEQEVNDPFTHCDCTYPD